VCYCDGGGGVAVSRLASAERLGRQLRGALPETATLQEAITWPISRRPRLRSATGRDSIGSKSQLGERERGGGGQWLGDLNACVWSLSTPSPAAGAAVGRYHLLEEGRPRRFMPTVADEQFVRGQ
jgi:hypothetical protein